MERKITIVVAFGLRWGQGLTRKGQERTFEGGGNVLYLKRALGYTRVYICQNSSYVHLIFVYFIVCKFYIERKNVNKF